jgi:hypothetical protein
MLILVWGLASEGPVRAVLEELDRLGATMQLVEQRAIQETQVELDIGSDVRGTIRTGGRVIDLAQVTACYLRPHDWTHLPGVAEAGPNSPAGRHAAEIQDALAGWTEVTSALVVNRLAAMAANGSKPYQLAWIRELGFRVPETIVTTVPAAARSFWSRHGCVVYKSVSAVRSRVSRLSKAHLERLDDITSCPTQFQQYIPGTDYRAHVVGNEIYSCRVRSDADDYRFPGRHDVAIDACQLPPDVSERCVQMAAAMNLPVAGIDLRCSRQDGEWYCFEVNPSPAFVYYEQATGLPIGAAVARLLVSGQQQNRWGGRGVGASLTYSEVSNASGP